MYLWNIDKLVEDLKNNALPEKKIKLFKIFSPLLSIFNTLFFSILLLTHQMIAYLFVDFLPKKDPYFSFYNRLGWTMGTLATCLTFFGFYLCYKINKQGDGKKFFERITCLSFPIYFNLTLYALACILLLLFVGFLIIQVKMMYFKYLIFLDSKTNINIAQALQCVIKDTPLEGLLGKIPNNKRNALLTICSAPLTLAKIPFIYGKVTLFLTDLRSSLLMLYPLLTIIPPALSLTHYLLVRRMLRRVCGITK
ncbi:hypothetical protein K9K77_01265 [Candidatus Babeliales bacterium]|nr:hypothetical protein [Candidatus Babeliales bacterium]